MAPRAHPFRGESEAEVQDFPDEVERLAGLLHACGIDRATKFRRSVAKLNTMRTGGFFYFENDGRPIVAIAPGARRPCNLWPTDRFASVCAHLTASGVAVFLVGSDADRAECEQINSLAGTARPTWPGNYPCRNPAHFFADAIC